MMRSVQDPRFPSMLLQIGSPGDLPLHSGLIPGDALYADSPPRNEEFSRYVRKIVALKFGRHCGMCGARHRHQPYWQLGMRVCSLCFAHNSISAGRLFKEYGVHFADVIAKRHERVRVRRSQEQTISACGSCGSSLIIMVRSWRGCLT